MIGRVLNGYKIVAAQPASMSDYYVVLAELMGEKGDKYVTALVHTSTMPAPDEWWTGYYTSDLAKAVESYHDRATTMPEGWAQVLTSYAETPVWHHLDGTPCRHEVSEEVPGQGICIDEDRRVKRTVYP